MVSESLIHGKSMVLDGLWSVDLRPSLRLKGALDVFSYRMTWDVVLKGLLIQQWPRQYMLIWLDKMSIYNDLIWFKFK